MIFINVTGNILFIRDDLAVTGTKQDGCSDKETMCTSETQILVTMTITQTQPEARWHGNTEINEWVAMLRWTVLPS